MKSEELVIPVEKKAAADQPAEPVTESDLDQPKWLKSTRGIVKLLHETFATIKTGILPILLFFFLFFPSVLGSGLNVFTDHLNIILDKMAENGQNVTFNGSSLSITHREVQLSPTERNVARDILAESGQSLPANRGGITTLTEEQLKTVGAALEEKKKESPDDNKLIDVLNNKVVGALSSISKPATTTVEGWIYLGKAKDNNTWEKAETIDSKTAIAELKPNTPLTLTDGAYLRAEALSCERSTGSIITAIPVGETVTIVNSPDICNKVGSVKAVWIKVRRN